MKKILSELERHSFLKIFFFSLICFVLLLGLIAFLRGKNNDVVFAQDVENEDVFVNSFLDFNNSEKGFSIFPPKDVKIIFGDTEYIYLAYDESVADVLDTYNIEYSEDDIVLPSLSADVRNTKIIKIILVNKKFVEVVKDIPFETSRVNDAELTYGEEIVEQEGKVGKQLFLYKDVYENGVYVKSEMQENNILEEPIQQIIRVGTKRSVLGVRDCPHWYSVVDGVTTNEEEREILKFLISCESGCNDARNNNNTYLGLLQFHRRTFASYGGVDIWDGADQIRTALRMIRKGGAAHHWPGCTRSFNN